MAYIFAHFREKLTPDGEQVYFSVSKDGLSWKMVNEGKPILTADLGEKGCRDIEILKAKDEFVILTTDLLIVARMDENHNVDWPQVAHNGSKRLRMWKSKDLINFSEEKLIYFGRDDFGCMWAPETFYDEKSGEYIIHWSSNTPTDNNGHTSIFCSSTKDFETFTYPEILFCKDNDIIDSHLTKFGDTYYLFYKNCDEPSAVYLATSKSLYGPYADNEGFINDMLSIDKPGCYEAPTTMVMPDGRWCLMIDFFGCEKEKMGYVPFISPEPGNCKFERCTEEFTFPYGFKHGGIAEITDEEYENIIKHYN